MIVAPLSSGSAGNAYWFESDGTAILVDAGIGPRDTKKRLEMTGYDLATISAIVLTHEHSDHIRGAEKIARKYGVPIYLTRGTLDNSSIDPGETKTVVFENDTSFTIGELQIHACRTIHDAADPACFVVEARDGTRFGIATDLGYVNPEVLRHLDGCDGLLFEANHDLDMLRLGSYPWSLKRRIMSRYGHLSNDDSVSAVQRLLGAELKTLCMIHLSQKNNNESIVRDMCTRLLNRTGASVEFAIARQFEPTGVFDVARRRTRSAPPGQMALF
ncbi:MAG TPA: MBL fold metallo-hydrolase [Thermoanaerobaculia bacterium]